MHVLLAAMHWVARAVVLVVIAIWAAASFAGAYVAMLFFWPFLSVVYLIVWPIARFIGHADTTGWGISLQKRSGRLRAIRVNGSNVHLGKRVLATDEGEFSIELAPPRWLEALYLILWAPFVLTLPVVVATALLQLVGREEPQVVVEWSWLTIGGVLIAGFYASLVGCVSWAAHEFVGPGMIGRRLAIPIVGHALCVAYRDVCAVEIGRDADRGDHVRLIRHGDAPMEIRAAARFLGRAQPTADLLPLAELLARAARVPMRPGASR
jgi:hypothetical protein